MNNKAGSLLTKAHSSKIFLNFSSFLFHKKKKKKKNFYPFQQALSSYVSCATQMLYQINKAAEGVGIPNTEIQSMWLIGWQESNHWA